MCVVDRELSTDEVFSEPLFRFTLLLILSLLLVATLFCNCNRQGSIFLWLLVFDDGDVARDLGKIYSPLLLH